MIGKFVLITGCLFFLGESSIWANNDWPVSDLAIVNNAKVSVNVTLPTKDGGTRTVSIDPENSMIVQIKLPFSPTVEVSGDKRVSGSCELNLEDINDGNRRLLNISETTCAKPGLACDQSPLPLPKKQR